MKYIEFRKGLSQKHEKRNTVIPLSELPQHLDPQEDCYRSLFFYDQKFADHVKEKGTVSGYRGKAGIDRLVFDFDNNDLEIARQDSLKLINKLKKEYNVQESEVGIFFSGRKGFALELKTDGIGGIHNEFNENIPYVVKRFCLNLAQELESFDRVIYNHNRLYRIVGSIHQKASTIDNHEVHLFKTSLPLKMLQESSIKEIQKYCIQMRVPVEFDSISDATKLTELAKKVIKDIQNAVRHSTVTGIAMNSDGLPDSGKCPRGQKVCMWRLCQGTVTQYRDSSLLRIAVHEKKQGMPLEVIVGKLRGVLDKMDAADPEKAKLDPMNDYDLERIAKQALSNDYDFGCNDSILSEICDNSCYLSRSKSRNKRVVSVADSYRRSKPFYREYYSNIVSTGLKGLDEEMPLFKGTFNLIVGKPGTGKTSLMLNILDSASRSGTKALFFSMDMSEEMLVQRFAPILLRDDKGRPKWSGKDFMIAHARHNEELMQEAEAVFDSLSDNVLIDYNTQISVENIRDEIKAQEVLEGRKPQLVIVDYVQLLHSEKEGYARHTENAVAITNLAKETGVCILGLSQTPRGGKDAEVLAKGSGAWEEKASTQINCWRPFGQTHPDHDFTMSIKMVKNRLGPSKRVDVYWHGPSGIIRDLMEEEEMQLEALRHHLDHD